MNQNTQKYISFVIVIIVIALGFFFLKSKDVVAPVDNINTELIDTLPIVEPSIETEVKPVTDNSDLTADQKALLAKLQKAVDARDFESFASALQEVYKKGWAGISKFIALESQLYVYATNEYWVKGDLENSLKVSTIVYDKVSEAWRFRYLRIITLEKYGRNALNVGDLVKAEDYAMQILQMMFRPEGSNLLADVYISKINTNIKNGDTLSAKNNLGFIWDYEVSQDRRDTLTDLKTQLGI